MNAKSSKLKKNSEIIRDARELLKKYPLIIHEDSARIVIEMQSYRWNQK